MHPDVKANFLMSPPLVVAYGIAGRIDIDLAAEPLGHNDDGESVYLRDILPASSEITELIGQSVDASTFKQTYDGISDGVPEWDGLASAEGALYPWREESTYVQKPPFFEDFKREPEPISEIKGARILGIFGDSVTTDHISPAGAIATDSPAGQYLIHHGVKGRDFNTYGARRGNDRVMARGTFANKRVKNLMLPGVEGGFTIQYPDEKQTTIYEAAMHYTRNGVPTVIFAGNDYGMGSSRDWAAKGAKTSGRQSGHRGKLRAYPPQQPNRNGNFAVAVPERRERTIPRIGWERSHQYYRRDGRPPTGANCQDGDYRRNRREAGNGTARANRRFNRS